MRRVQNAIRHLAAEIQGRSSEIGNCVIIDQDVILDRSDALALEPPDLRSANGTCHLLAAEDGWIAVNMARDSDLELIPAWLGSENVDATKDGVAERVKTISRRKLISDARVLGLPVAAVGEKLSGVPRTWCRRLATNPARQSTSPLRVVDLSALWAGPLCGSIFTQMGADVTKVASARRPEGMREDAPAFYDRLNKGKSFVEVDFGDPKALEWLRATIVASDILITSARPRAFEQLGLGPEALFSANGKLTWIAITGYGWFGDESDRVAFGDDAAAAGGLIGYSPNGDPHFIGDALADPLTGMVAAAVGARAVLAGGGILVDAALAHVAATVAAQQIDTLISCQIPSS